MNIRNTRQSFDILNIFFLSVLAAAALSLLLILSGCSAQKAESGMQDSSDAAQSADQKESSDLSDETSAQTPDGTPVALHGKLSLNGTHIVDEHGDDYQLRGISTHGINWFPEYINEEGFQTLRDEWNVNCIRLALYTAEYNGYCEGGDKEELKQLIYDAVGYASDLGIYVIVDWHVLHDLNPLKYESEAADFFREMSSAFADKSNVLYEICNEPNGDTDWSDVKEYAEEIIPIIRGNAPDSLVIVGTPNWSQDIDISASDRLTGDIAVNTLYAVHFYADTHTQWLRDRVVAAIEDGMPVFFSEFGTCDASGNGANNFVEAEAWLELADQYDISYCMWNLSNKDETSSIISPDVQILSGWSDSELTETGRWYKNRLLSYDPAE